MDIDFDQIVNRLNSGASTWGRWALPSVERRVKRGRQIHLTHRVQLQCRMRTILTGVARKQGTTAAILIQIQ